MILYRGFSAEKELTRMRKGGIAPEDPIPLGKLQQILTALFKEKVPQSHVLGEIRKHCVSFSLKKSIASFYATSDENGP